MTIGDSTAETTGMFVGQGEMRARCRALDWSATPLGPVTGWPQSLRTAAELALATGFPAIVLWGRELVQIYNDAYVPIIGAKHPGALGRGNLDVWPEVAHINGPVYDRVFAGETVTLEDALFPLARGTDAEDVYLTITYAPVRDESGGVGGVLVTMFETTAQVHLRMAQAERDRLFQELEFERARLAEAFHRAPSFLAILRGEAHVFEWVNDAYLQLVGRREVVGRPLLEALPEVREQGFVALLDRVLATGEPFVGREIAVTLARAADGGLEERFVDFVYTPLLEADGTRSGVMAHGGDVTDHVLARREIERLLAESEASRRALQTANANLEAQQLELELTNQQLQDAARDYESQAELLDVANRELRATETRMRDVFEQAPVAVAVMTGPDLVYTIVSPRYAESPGGGRPLLGRPIREAFPELAGEPFFEIMERVYQAGEPYFASERRVPLDRDGDGVPEEYFFDVGYQPLRDADGRVYAVASVALDITAQVRARREVEEATRAAVRAEQHLTRTFEQAPVAIAVLEGPEHRFTLANPGYRALVGGREVVGRTVREALPEIEGQGLLELLDQVFTSGEPFVASEFPLRFQARPGAAPEDRVLNFTYQPLRDPAGAVYAVAAVAVDVTEQVRAREGAEEANRAKSQFLTTMSHELRTPLNAVAGYADLLLMGVRGDLAPAQREDVERIKRSGQHLLSLINDILNFAKIEAGQVEFDLQRVPLALLLQGLEDLVAPQLRARGVHFRAPDSDDELAVCGDEEKIRQVLLNLLTNAVKFTDAGGEVAIGCDADPRWVRLHVRDTGRGIAAESLPRIFDPFVQVDRHLTPSSQQGVGLGLAISRDLARGMGGDLTVESVLGEGSIFTLSLPRAD